MAHSAGHGMNPWLPLLPQHQAWHEILAAFENVVIKDKNNTGPMLALHPTRL